MEITELDYSYPDQLIAKEPQPDVRGLLAFDDPQKVTKDKILSLFEPGDVLVINTSRVQKRRVFSKEGFEILFVQKNADSPESWEVLFPARSVKLGQVIALPGGVEMRLLRKGLPQHVELSEPLIDNFFEKYGEVALPPYIQEARKERHMKPEDEAWYQTAWAEELGSCACPTASLHFKDSDLKFLQARGIKVAPIILHVGLGTFLPIKSQNLSEHKMHKEWVSLPEGSVTLVDEAKANGGQVWALGTTAIRALESWKLGLLNKNGNGGFEGETDLFIRPGFEFQAADFLLTNFHQPRSTLMALVMAFAGQEKVKKAYEWAIENQFQLFSYGDLSIWKRA